MPGILLLQSNGKGMGTITNYNRIWLVSFMGFSGGHHLDRFGGFWNLLCNVLSSYGNKNGLIVSYSNAQNDAEHFDNLSRLL